VPVDTVLLDETVDSSQLETVGYTNALGIWERESVWCDFNVLKGIERCSIAKLAECGKCFWNPTTPSLSLHTRADRVWRRPEKVREGWRLGIRIRTLQQRLKPGHALCGLIVDSQTACRLPIAKVL
jgi:hypothetical protein